MHFTEVFENVFNKLNLCLQLALTLLQFRDMSTALSQHRLLLLERKLQLQVLLIGALTNQSGTVEVLLQGGHLRSRQSRVRSEGEVKERRAS